MNNKTLGIIGMIASPCLAIELYMDNRTGTYVHSMVGSILSMCYLVGWISCVIALYRSNAAGKNFLGRSILLIQISMLLVAFSWSIFDLIQPNSNSFIYKMLDASWPISNLLMIILGIVIIINGQLKGFDKFIVLLVGLWLPLTILIGVKGSSALAISCMYSM